MFFGGAAISSCAILAFFSVLCTAQIHNQNLLYDRGMEVNAERQNRTENNKSMPLQCYVCNSAFDPRCADPFDPYTIGIINCSDRPTPEHVKDHLHLDRIVVPVVCRKMVQKVEGVVRVVRSCGYIRDDHDDKKCFRRTGTAAVEVIHCSCTKSLCNAGHSSQRPYFSAISLNVAITLAITNLLGGQTS
ncbi:uncharacterized protein LOC108907669 [Anoplophora glabripennis]|uniref:uncharacterized protein LOC108907669 n=1 Tax=Anoplophora glabripennis TaxID=217634 RepID=UPI000873628E|nr:uncharacterized protein LOC108907669 [Anoplophora glabripennis]